MLMDRSSAAPPRTLLSPPSAFFATSVTRPSTKYSDATAKEAWNAYSP